MAQQYGLGRGLSSLIPPKKPEAGESVSGVTQGPGTNSPFAGAQPVGSVARQPVSTSPFVINPASRTNAPEAPSASNTLGALPQATQPIQPTQSNQSTQSLKSPVSPVSPPPSLSPVSTTPASGALSLGNTLSAASAPTQGKPLASPRTGFDQESVVNALLHKIAPNPEQPRVQFDKDKLSELAQSIREHGILQPLVVTRKGDGYELIAGERRLQASKLAGLTEVPVIIREADERTKLELAIIENTQRHNLNPIEEAKAYLRLMEEYGLHQEEVAKKMGKSRSLVANTVRLLHLPVEIQRSLIEGKISEGHAKALLSIENPEKQRALFEMIVKSGLTVRETELEARAASTRPHVRSLVQIPPEFSERLEKLREKLGTRVKLSPSGPGGKIVIEYYSAEELQGLFERFGL
jgi:ParB family chromosome partitioning protein